MIGALDFAPVGVLICSYHAVVGTPGDAVEIIKLQSSVPNPGSDFSQRRLRHLVNVFSSVETRPGRAAQLVIGNACLRREANPESLGSDRNKKLADRFGGLGIRSRLRGPCISLA